MAELTNLVQALTVADTYNRSENPAERMALHDALTGQVMRGRDRLQSILNGVKEQADFFRELMSENQDIIAQTSEQNLIEKMNEFYNDLRPVLEQYESAHNASATAVKTLNSAGYKNIDFSNPIALFDRIVAEVGLPDGFKDAMQCMVKSIKMNHGGISEPAGSEDCYVLLETLGIVRRDSKIYPEHPAYVHLETGEALTFLKGKVLGISKPAMLNKLLTSQGLAPIDYIALKKSFSADPKYYDQFELE